MSAPNPWAIEATSANRSASIDDAGVAFNSPSHSVWPPTVTVREGVSARDLAPLFQRLAAQHVETSGALLFRNLQLDGVEAFRNFASSFGGELLGYDFGSTPRTKVSSGIYTSTEYPAHQRIPLHNEQSYSHDWPLRIWFFCVMPARQGGQTPIADSRAIYQRLDPALRRRFEKRRLMYVRNFGNGLDLPWPKVFDTDRRDDVESYCRAHGVSCEWKPNGELRTRQVCRASARHPGTNDMVWFNQAHLFHVSALDAETRETLLEVVPKEDLPRNVYYGTGAPIEESALDEIRGVLDEAQVTFAWSAGDVLMLDNMLTAHGRTPFVGERKVVVAMTHAYGTRHVELESDLESGAELADR